MQKAKFPAIAATFVLCYAFWILLDFSFKAQELIAGAVVSLLVALFSARFFIHENAGWFFHPGRFFSAIFFWCGTFMVELVKANVDMAKRCYGGCTNVNPGIVKVPSELTKDYGEAMLANSITLTPGTITLDIAEQDGKNYYYIHWIDVSDPDREKAGEVIKGRMENWIRRIWE